MRIQLELRMVTRSNHPIYLINTLITPELWVNAARTW